MNEIGFDPVSNSELARRTGYIEDREDLFRTKVFEVVGNSDISTNSYEILTLVRDPGSANCLVPVLKLLHESSNFNLSIIADGRGEEIAREQLDLSERPTSTPLEADNVIRIPNLILADASEEQGLERYANATFDEIPMVLVEDYYGSSLDFIEAMRSEPGLHLPEIICVMDEAAKQIIIEKYPDLTDKIVVTGQPAFDRIAHEDTAKISQEARERLHLSHDEKIIAFMSTGDHTPEQFGMIIDQIKKSTTDFTFIFRKHPRDNRTYEEYYNILDEKEVKHVDSRKLSTDQVSAAADIVFTTWSTAGLEAIYRGKPTIHIVDHNLLDVPESVRAIPPARLNASIQVDNISTIPENIDTLLDSNSELVIKIKENMRRFYPSDGRNAERVVKIIVQLLNKKQE